MCQLCQEKNHELFLIAQYKQKVYEHLSSLEMEIMFWIFVQPIDISFSLKALQLFLLPHMVNVFVTFLLVGACLFNQVSSGPSAGTDSK